MPPPPTPFSSSVIFPMGSPLSPTPLQVVVNEKCVSIFNLYSMHVMNSLLDIDVRVKYTGIVDE